jgi:phosphoglycerate dehydrogenase-like enzyme
VIVWLPHPSRPGFFDDLPVTIEICPSPLEMPSDPDAVEFFVPPFLSTGRVVPMIDAMASLRVIQLLSAGADAWVGRIPAGVTLCDARGVHNASTSEWALTAILSYFREFPKFAVAQSQGHWMTRAEIGAGTDIVGKKVLIIGAGAIGEALTTRLIACEAEVALVGRTAREGIHGIDEVPALLPQADVVVLLIPKTSETVGLVNAAFLASMRDGALLVNAARGPIVDTDALLAECSTGRIGAAVDVTEPEPLPDGHPLWRLPNVLITPHVGGTVTGMMDRAYRLVREQMVRHLAGEELINQVVGDY